MRPLLSFLMPIALAVACHPGKSGGVIGSDGIGDGDPEGADTGTCSGTGVLWYPDADGDGYGGGYAVRGGCEAPEGYVADSTDCDDQDPTAWMIGDGTEQVRNRHLPGFCDGYCVRNPTNVLIGDDVTSLEDLRCVTSIGGFLAIEQSATIANLDGLRNLTTVEGDFSIYDSDAIRDLSAMASLTHVGTALILQYSDSLSDVTGLSNIEYVGTSVHIQGNTSLPTASAEALVSGIDYVGGDVYISGNAP